MIFKQVDSNDFERFEGVVKYFYPQIFEAFHERRGTLFTTQRLHKNDVLYFVDDEVYIIVQQIKNKSEASQYLQCYPQEILDKEVRLYTNNVLIFETLKAMNVPREKGYFCFVYNANLRNDILVAEKRKNKMLYILIFAVIAVFISKCAFVSLFSINEYSNEQYHSDEWNDYFFDDNEQPYWDDEYQEEDEFFDDYYSEPGYDESQNGEPNDAPVGT